MRVTYVFFCVLAQLVLGARLHAQVRTVSSDTDWRSQQAVVKNSMEAEYIIRVGDVDNLNFGWPDSFDPFCGRMTESHFFPWEPDNDDLPGFDRILLSSKFNPSKEQQCGGDGYSSSFNPSTSKPVTWTIPTEALNGVAIQNAYLQIFIDDFQAPTFCSKFVMTINGKRFIEGEKILNAIDQTGPVGKLIAIPVTEEFYPMLTQNKSISLYIDETTGAADGFAVDFIRVLINRKRENSCIGSIVGKVLEKGSYEPIVKAKVLTTENIGVETNANGEFQMKSIPTGMQVLKASAKGYSDETATADVGEGENSDEIVIFLEKGKSTKFDNKSITVGESITLNNILFDQGKAIIKNESKPELDKVVSFLKANPNAEIELSGHTSSEGEREYNRSLSYKRVAACKDYIVAEDIAEDRIIAVGFGPDRPVASNDTEAGRIQNRRVEMRITKL
ncbi:MAG TPA: OmpA family protein [Cyclobacteriaceae bacterium]|nr:OmpA family protein [Cyclobacteriaceae bacterium]